MAVRGLIFDMDGTMVDNMGWHLRTWMDIFDELAVAMSPEEFHRRLAGRTNEAIFAAVCGDDMSRVEATRRGEEKEERYRALYGPHLCAIDGLEELLVAAAGRGVACAVATSADPPNIDFVLDGLDLRRHFQAVVGGREVANAKPAPDLFLEAARRLDLAPADCLVIEDTRSGLQAAHAAGMRSVAISTSLLAAELCDLPGVCLVIADYRGCEPWSLLAD